MIESSNPQGVCPESRRFAENPVANHEDEWTRELGRRTPPGSSLFRNELRYHGSGYRFFEGRTSKDDVQASSNIQQGGTATGNRLPLMARGFLFLSGPQRGKGRVPCVVQPMLKEEVTPLITQAACVLSPHIMVRGEIR